ncbi:MAG: rod shape-determining protein MreC [Candidatus Magasanikbacteria bacterium RIFOXYC2_FULL_42_28]|uniref:Cell shape-determining protein MreC n=1 Tax=Candidatus Magasanikbacteria bacterium RIFOXYC2_FULL_42_28 TaxID=1798704 RepID=A0A1F6NW69_9BACT|nr:MAG: rod shape-determining protein MreC [Candidatus Magasanikbacteria bacterium RIFOXYC2_FULL_42_28]
MANNRRSNRNILSFAFLAIIFLAHIFGLLKPMESKIRLLLSPLLAKIYGSTNPELFKISKQELYGQYQQCLAVQNETAYFRAQTEMLKIENQNLRLALKFSERAPYKLITAQVIGRSIDLSEQTLLINVGQNSGLTVNQPVIVGEGQLVGKITNLDANSAWVRLLSDSRSKIAALILNDEKSGGVVEGGYGLSIKMEFIPRNETVKIGDQVITSGLESNVPKGLLIGTVAALENEAYKPFQQAIITPAGSLEKIDIVSVIIN